MTSLRFGCTVLAGALVLTLGQVGWSERLAASASPAGTTEGVCGLISNAELRAAFGADMQVATDLLDVPTSMGCVWRAPDGAGGYLSITLVPAENLEPPKSSKSYRPVDGAGAEAFVAAQLGGWVAGALAGETAIKLQVDGGTSSEAATVQLLKLVVERNPHLSADGGAGDITADPLRVLTACELLPSSEMSAILGQQVVAAAEERVGKSLCTYTREGTFLSIDIAVEPGMGAAGMAGAAAAGRAEPGLAESLEGLGDEAAQIGPMLMIRRGADLVILTLSGVDDVVATGKQIMARSKWPDTVVASGDHDQARGSGDPSDAARLPMPVEDGAIPGVAVVIGALRQARQAGTVGKDDREAAPEVIAASFSRPATLGEPCPEGGPSAVIEMAAEAAALVPLMVGMTLSSVWIWEGDDYDHECLVQVTAVGADGVTTTTGCPVGPKRTITPATRQVCRVDMRDGLTHQTKTGAEMPATIAGATHLTLSQASFNALKAAGSTWHRYLELSLPGIDESADDLRGIVKRTGTGSLKTIVNDRVVDLPVIFAAGTLYREPYDGVREELRMAVLDDARFPLILDYSMADGRFRINYTKITYPALETLERQLAADEPVAIYGLYFDFAEYTLRPESDAVLKEIAGVLEQHSDWALSVDGHTDNLGGDAFNLDLSKRRAAAVMVALIGDYGIAAERLKTDGHGARQPKAGNETPEGRARNRRVELRRFKAPN